MKETHQDVRDITAGILAIQTADEAMEAANDIDTSCMYRGASAGMHSTFLRMAKGLGMSNNKFPESNVKDLLNRAKAKFVRNFIFILISTAARKQGFSEDDSIEFAALTYRMEKEIGRSDISILERWI